MKTAANIRKDLIVPNLEELTQHGNIGAVPQKSAGRGRPGKAYYLNEAQALLVRMFSRTATAAKVRKAIRE
ncbi:hypothetical protein [Rhizobium sp. NZLR11]|nr:hypothetical protein [Rhizobium sp. NZLR11]MBX5165709.1 hypothetical protein [Rhizobium sp. NZLR4b]MBX5209134.1 hypothetical protein [Rhizobium sp. NZLR11]